MDINSLTKIKDILAEYPWFKDEAIKLDSRLKMVDSPIGKMLLNKATIADAAAKAGISEEKIIAKIKEMIANHKG